MTKAEIVNNISGKLGLEKSDTQRVVESFMEEVIKSLVEGENVYLRGFGSFTIKTRAEKTGRNMLVSGSVILIFLLLHLYDFWVPTITDHYIVPNPEFAQGNYFMDHLNHVFTLEGALSFVRLVIYIVAFVFLSLHLQHGFASAFQSIGARHNKYTPVIVAFGKWYSILIPAGFIIIAVYHFFVK